VLMTTLSDSGCDSDSGSDRRLGSVYVACVDWRRIQAGKSGNKSESKWDISIPYPTSSRVMRFRFRVSLYVHCYNHKCFLL